MKILLTGATGFIGKNLYEHFNNGKNEIMCVGRQWNQVNIMLSDGNIHNAKEFTTSQIQHYQPDLIIHCAAEIYKDELMMESNVLFTQWLLDVTKEVNYKCFINIGSSSEYGFKENKMEETMVLEPRTMYEATKGAATLLCEAHARIYNKPIVTVRPFSVFGKYEPAHRLIPTIIRNITEGKQTVISPGVHDWIYINDFVAGIDALIRAVNLGYIKMPEIYNFGSGDQCSNLIVYEMIKALMKSNIEPILTEDKLRPFDSRYWSAETTKSFVDLNWHVQYLLSEALKELLLISESNNYIQYCAQYKYRSPELMLIK